jgi:drug/metabolite transporter (DMT)-like permease
LAVAPWALTGVALTSGVLTSPRTLHWASDLEVLTGAASWSCCTVLIARLNQRYGAVGVTGAVLVVGTVALMVISVPMIRLESWPDSSMTLALAAMGIASSTVGFLLWNYAGALLPAERLGLFLYLIPVVCVAAGAQLLNESLTLPILIGGALTVFGVWIASRAAAPDAAILESTRKLARIPFAANIFRGKSPAPRPPTGPPKEDAQGLTPGVRRP